MEKGFIVIDIPEKCETCPFERVWDEDFFGDEYIYGCSPAGGGCTNAYRKHGRPGWCPIKEVPKKSEVVPLGETSYVSGWNACIDEILKTE